MSTVRVGTLSAIRCGCRSGDFSKVGKVGTLNGVELGRGGDNMRVCAVRCGVAVVVIRVIAVCVEWLSAAANPVPGLV